MKIDEVDKIARGRVWAASSAIKLNLVDQIGGLNEAVEEAKKLAKIPSSEGMGIIIYPKKKSFFDMILDLTGSKTEAAHPVLAFEKQVSLYKKFFPAFMVPYKISIE